MDEGNHSMQDPSLNGPAGHPHVDYCGSKELIKAIQESLPLPDELKAKFKTGSRYAFIGTWRPLKTIVKDPFALCDAATVPDSDYQLKTRVYPNGMLGANHIMGHGSEKEQHRWYYMNGMTTEEMVVFNGHDSKQDEPGFRCPHTGFLMPGTEDAPPRESIETRVVCFWD